MGKKITLRKKHKLSKRNLKKINKKHNTFTSKNRKKNKSLRNKRFKGGFNAIQFAGALAVAAALDMDKIVLIPNVAGRAVKSKRYDIEIDQNNKPIIKSGKLQTASRMRVNIKNFDIYVGSTTSDLLIKIEGNDSLIRRLAEITQTVVQPQNAGALIESGQNAGLITAEEANNMNESVQQDLPAANAMLMSGNVEPKSSNFEKVFQIVMTLLKLLMSLIFLLLSKLPKEPVRPETTMPQDPQTQVLTVLEGLQDPQSQVLTVFEGPQDIQIQVLTVFEGTPDAENNATANDAAEQLNNDINNIGQLPQFRDNDSENPIPAESSNFKCVTPYNRDTASAKNRTKSCNKIGTPHENFKERIWPNLQSCVNECYID
jgi:hypothetical protein